MIEKSFIELEKCIEEADRILDEHPTLFSDHASANHINDVTMLKAFANFESMCLRSMMAMGSIKDEIGYTEETVFDKEISHFFDASYDAEDLVQIMFQEVGYLKALSEIKN